MNAYYPLPTDHDAGIARMRDLAEAFAAGRIGADELKAVRVPWGVYEQRTRGLFMARVRCPGGCVGLAQLAGLARVAAELGTGLVHCTTRQEVQVHDLPLERVPEAMRRLGALGLSTRGGGGNTVRNIAASWDAGVAADEAFDVTPHTLALTAALTAEPASYTMPRKFKVALSGSLADGGGARFNDLGFLALTRDGRRGFAVYIAGGMGSRPRIGTLLHDFLPEEDILACAAAVRDVFSAHGNRKNRHTARLRFLVELVGQARFAELYTPEFARHKAGRGPLALPAVPAGPRPGLPAATPAGDFALWRRRHARAQRQPDRFSVTIPLEAGNIRAAELERLAAALAPLGEHCLRLDMRQNMVVRDVREAELPALHGILLPLAPLAAEPAFTGRAVVCSGARMCQLGICNPPGLLAALRRTLAAAGDIDAARPFAFNVSGCPNSCGQHMSADLGLYGRSQRRDERPYPSYGVVAGARRGTDAALAKPVGEVPAYAVPAFVLAFLRECAPRAAAAPSFADWVDAGGAGEIKALCARFPEPPPFAEDKNPYYDWGADEPFSLAGRSQGECAAGLYDLIEIDRREVARNRELLASGAGAEEAATLARLADAACRMLLIARGAEARSRPEVYALFRRHFLEGGLVDAGFADVVAAAEADPSGRRLQSLRGRLLTLADAVLALYAGMDASFRFQVAGAPASAPAPVAPPSAPAAADALLDCRGVGCPMNFVKVKMRLAGMSSGQVLDVLLDDGEPADNVPKSAGAEGHEVLRTGREGPAWRVSIKKA